MKSVSWSSHQGPTIAHMPDRSFVCTSLRRSPWTPHGGLRVFVGQVTQRQAGHPRLLLSLWLRCRRCLCMEEMGTGNARIWSSRDPLSWVCEWRQNRTLNLNFKKVGGEKLTAYNNNKKAASLRLKGGGFVVVEARARKQWCPGMEPEPQSLCHTPCWGFI